MGFYTARFVEAPSEEEAEQVALAMLRSEYQFSEAVRAKAPDARVYFEEVDEITPGSEMGPHTGAVWFDMEDDSERDRSESECRQ